jgi:hypothetical protein
LLFVTLNETRVENVRRETHDLPEKLAGYYRFTTYEQAMGDFLGPIWQSRLLSDTQGTADLLQLTRFHIYNYLAL